MTVRPFSKGWMLSTSESQRYLPTKGAPQKPEGPTRTKRYEQVTSECYKEEGRSTKLRITHRPDKKGKCKSYRVGCSIMLAALRSTIHIQAWLGANSGGGPVPLNKQGIASARLSWAYLQKEPTKVEWKVYKHAKMIP